MDPESPQRDSRAPEGAHCAEHPERPAHFTCGRCGSYACISCWHPSIARCQQCLKRDPTEAAPPIPWEEQRGAPVLRFLGTLATAMQPMRSAPAFARDDLGAALRFALLSALPLALLAGVIPHTRTLMFTGDFKINLIGRPDQAAIALDVARSMGVHLVLSAIDLLCLLLPFVSLVRAYAPARSYAATRVLLYRFWVLPGAALLFYLVLWGMPPSPHAPTGDEASMPLAASQLFAVLTTLVLIEFAVSMSSTARLACGLGPLMSFVVAFVPLALLLLVKPLASLAMDGLLPAIKPPPG